MKHAAVLAIIFAGLVAAVPAAAAPDDVTIDDVNAAPRAETAPTECVNCPPPRKYDSRETIKTRQDVERLIKRIDTYSIAPPKQESAKGNAGIYVRPDVTLVNFVTHRYRVIYAPALVSASEVAEHPAPAVYRPARRCKYGHCRPLRVRG